MKAKFLLEHQGKTIDRPSWVDDDNAPFQTAADARDWGDEITPGAGCFRIVGVDCGYSEERRWIRTGPIFTGISDVHTSSKQDGNHA